jgi:hypothetical protein
MDDDELRPPGAREGDGTVQGAVAPGAEIVASRILRGGPSIRPGWVMVRLLVLRLEGSQIRACRPWSSGLRTTGGSWSCEAHRETYFPLG